MNNRFIFPGERQLVSVGAAVFAVFGEINLVVFGVFKNQSNKQLCRRDMYAYF